MSPVTPWFWVDRRVLVRSLEPPFVPGGRELRAVVEEERRLAAAHDRASDTLEVRVVCLAAVRREQVLVGLDEVECSCRDVEATAVVGHLERVDGDALDSPVLADALEPLLEDVRVGVAGQ